jgi:hypothetical protein
MRYKRRKGKSMAVLAFKDKILSIKEIESYFGFDKVKPISLTPSDEKDMTEKGDCYNKWYEEELRKLYDAK